MERMTAEEFRHLRNQRTPVNKHRNRPTVYRGIRYDSVLEARFAARLDLAQRLGWILSWTRQVPFWIYGRDRLDPTGKHIVDFMAIHHGGRIELIEVKGRDLEAGRLKRAWIEQEYGLPVAVITRKNIEQWRPEDGLR